MKIINTEKKYFNNEEMKNNLSMTSLDNIYNKEKNKILDNELDDLILYIKTLINYNTLQTYDIEDTNDFYTNNLKLFIVGNVAYICGSIYPKKLPIQGNYTINLPFKIYPASINGIREWSPFIVDGVLYKRHVEITDENFSQISLFFYDSITSAAIIPINIFIPLSTVYRT